MNRITKKDLKEKIKQANAHLIIAGSPYHYEIQGRSGYQAVDLYKGAAMVSVVGMGTSREAIAAVNAHLATQLTQGRQQCVSYENF